MCTIYSNVCTDTGYPVLSNIQDDKVITIMYRVDPLLKGIEAEGAQQVGIEALSQCSDSLNCPRPLGTWYDFNSPNHGMILPTILFICISILQEMMAQVKSQQKVF